LGDSQIDSARTVEVDTILAQLEADLNYQGHFVYMVVNKLVNAKFYPTNLKGNVMPGTYVEDVGNNSFYMVTQTAFQGTVTPTKYHVIENRGNYAMEALGQLAYNQCYNYFNWQGSIKIPAPTMMAHKIAYLVANSIK
jgi:aubergine-like protein